MNQQLIEGTVPYFWVRDLAGGDDDEQAVKSSDKGNDQGKIWTVLAVKITE